MTTQTITQDDLNSAARGLRMLAKSPSQLDAIAATHAASELFASRVIVKAARQMAAAKRRAGAEDSHWGGDDERAEARQMGLTALD